MIDLHTIYYRNIGPFGDRECSLLFQQGKFLIKAPIGSGKSFLFFDGATYALYKNSSRNMLNLKSKEGEISLIFSEGEDYYLVRRHLKAGKKMDSCSSQLFSISFGNGSDLDILKKGGQTLQRDRNIIQEFFDNNNIKLAEIPVKNENDFQKTLEQLLPPEEVFLSTMLLLQDADNIFELLPSKRIEVLKNIFGLLGIENAKEQVNERKKGTILRLKTLQDHSMQDVRLRNLLKECKNLVYTIGITDGNKFFEDLEDVLNQLTISNFSLNGLDIQLFEARLGEVKKNEKEVIQLKTKQDNLENQLREQEQLQRKLREEEISLTTEIDRLEKVILSVNLAELDKLKTEKNELYIQLEEIDKVEAIISFDGDEAKSLDEVLKLIQRLKDHGKDLANQITQLELQQKNLDQAVEFHTEQENTLKNQLLQTQTELDSIDKETENQATFECEKIQGNCPFVKTINRQHFEQRIEMKSRFEKNIVELKDKLEELKKVEIKRNVIDIESSQKKVQELRDYLVKIDFTKWEEKGKQKASLQNKLNTLDQHVMKLEIESQKLQDYHQQKSALMSRKDVLGEQKNGSIKLNQELETQLKEYKMKLSSPEMQSITNQLNALEKFFQIIRDLNQLIEDFAEKKVQIKQLEIDENILKNLEKILGKELILIAIEQFLPALNDIVNNFLTKVVDYQISMQITESGDKIELEAKITDEKGEREVKSLSGGQRTLLKLVWMLAISSFMKTPLLFLDETINNLDADTVGKVSDMINEFVKQRTMKFYTVTHNTEIQEMNIWDDTIEI
ncbi:double-stranded DNA repair protein Rad50 [candidate division SR1 bacterium]|nr:double-stranded DNA repair protein Rad50 [candidate division SR1 bacterium]